MADQSPRDAFKSVRTGIAPPTATSPAVGHVWHGSGRVGQRIYKPQQRRSWLALPSHRID